MLDEDTPFSGAAPRRGTNRARRSRTGGDDPTQGTAADQTREADPHEVARSIALRQLSMAPRSRRQLLTKLVDRGVSEQVADEVLDRFEEVQLVDDAEFARMWVRSRANTRSLARSAIKRELAEKGITGALAEEALAQRSDEDERSAAIELVRKKARSVVEPADRAGRDKQVRRLVAMLARKGYSPGMAFSIVKDVLDEQTDSIEGS